MYAHISKSFVKQNDIVTKGQVLGLTGTTGNANGMTGEDQHLHFEYRVGPELVNLGKGLVGRGDPNQIVETKFEQDPKNPGLVHTKVSM